jgi:diguanylate cyclase (GGDEF)-like protein
VQVAALVLIDQVHFKEVTNRLGHLSGDTTLVAFAQCMRSAATHFVARFGGEEFALL